MSGHIDACISPRHIAAHHWAYVLEHAVDPDFKHDRTFRARRVVDAHRHAEVVVPAAEIVDDLAFGRDAQALCERYALNHEWLAVARSLAAEWAPAIRVNVIAPSLTDTPLAAALLNSDLKKEAAAKRHPLQQVGRSEDLAALVAHHRETDAAATLLTTHLDDPTGYGRILRTPSGDVHAIVEHRDADEAQRAVDEINAGGGINGRKLKLVVEDHGYDPKKAVLATQKLVQKDKIFAMLAPMGSPTVLAAQDILLEAGVPLRASHLMYLNPQCRHPHLDDLFTSVEVTTRAEPVVLALPAAVSTMLAWPQRSSTCLAPLSTTR